MMRQIMLLDSKVPESYNPEDYIVSSCNKYAYNYIVSWPSWHLRFLLLEAPNKGGKKHLANVWGARSKAITIDDGIVADYHNFLEHYDAFILHCSDLLQYESMLFHIYNIAKERNKWCLWTVNNIADIKLPDLRSRLLSLPSINVLDPDETLCKYLLIRLFSEHQISVNSRVVDYILDRIHRSFEAINNIVPCINDLLTNSNHNANFALIKAAINQVNQKYS